MEGVLIFFGIIGALFLGAWHLVGYEWRKAEEREKAEQELLRLQLEKEMRMPMTRIVFELSNGERKQFELIEPIIEGGRVISSHKFASIMLDTCFEVGYLRDEEKVKYPVCNVAKAWLEKDKA
jgi:hypothetical protein